MNMRRLAGLTAIQLLIAGCGSSQASREDLESEVESLRSQLASAQEEIEQKDQQLSDIRDKVEAARSASSDLESAAGRFSGENWRTVVPDVVSAQDDVDTATSELEDAAAEQ